MARKKTFILDTNVLLHDPYSIHSFGTNDIVIPITVIEEIDKFKKNLDDIGRNARLASRIIDGYRQLGKLGKGVIMKTGGTIFVKGQKEEVQIPKGLVAGNPDDQILAVALAEKQIHPRTVVVFISKDVNLRIKANAYDLPSDNYEESVRITENGQQNGVREVIVSSAQIDEFFTRHCLELDLDKSWPNMGVILKCENSSQSALGSIDPETGQLIPLSHYKNANLGIRPLNVQQKFLLEYLLDDRISLVTIDGKAGTGKTLLALAAGLQMVLSDEYNRLLVSRPVIPMGREVGYLPGKLEEKLIPWMQPVFDNLDLILEQMDPHQKKEKRWSRQKLIQNDMLEIEALAFIRGRSLPNQFFVVDEAQNLSRHEVKTIISRAGQDTKVVLTGDQYQIDNPYVDQTSNGLSYVVEKFRDQPLAAHITLQQGERSPLAELATELL